MMSEPIRVARVEDIEEGEALLLTPEVTGAEVSISVFHAEDGAFYALDDECTHGAASLSEGLIEEDTVECPKHAAAFCLRDGRALSLPATVDTRTHQVEVRDGEIYLRPGVPAEA